MSQLTNYIQKELDKGFSKDLVTKKLLQAGYTQEEITDSFKSLKSAEPILRRKFADTLHLETHIQWSKWLFGLLAIAVVLVLGFLVYQYAGELPSLPAAEDEKTSCDTLTTVEEKDKCFLELAATGEDVCDKIISLPIKALCENKSWETDDCNYLIITGGDFEQCLWDKAIETGDSAYCSKMIHQRSECLYQLAQKLQDPSVCRFDFTCYKEYAIATHDREVCALLRDKVLMLECYTLYDAEKT